MSPADGSANPLPNARNEQGNPHTETYNMRQTSYVSSGKNNEKDSVCKPKCFCSKIAHGEILHKQLLLQVLLIIIMVAFAYSASDTKNGSIYQAGGSTSSCDGNGIYFLTDGSPNSTKDSMAQTIMNTSLNNSASFGFTETIRSRRFSIANSKFWFIYR